jgi:hypothetical protein
MKKKSGPLRIATETVRRLTAPQMQSAEGGATTNTHLCIKSKNGYTCETIVTACA